VGDPGAGRALAVEELMVDPPGGRDPVQPAALMVGPEEKRSGNQYHKNK